MRRALLVAPSLLVAAVALAQEDASQYEAVLKEVLVSLDRMTGVLTNIKDATSAADTRPELKKAAEQFLAVRKRAEKLPQPGPEERERIAKQYQKKLAEAVGRLKSEIARVQTVPGGRDTLLEIAALEPPKTQPDGPKKP